ncbi:hypothetical protein XbrCFBP1976_19060 [Xanthomonas bromi]|uniref:Uncharacterized protein n=1 Tax=Xanthomonas bromi TaxID=56449 RepID=A0ABX5BKE8_9XANT|nr:hypothetical protein XbrCFBP1976_19060 [Xanthomonas bromi]
MAVDGGSAAVSIYGAPHEPHNALRRDKAVMQVDGCVPRDPWPRQRTDRFRLGRGAALRARMIPHATHHQERK